MEIKITQNSVGKYNFCSSEESLEFSMALYHEGSIVSNETHKAILGYSGEPGEQDEFTDNAENIGWVFGKCLGYAKRICSSTDYEGNCYFFAKTFSNNFEETSTSFGAKRKDELTKKLARIQSELDSDLTLEDTREDIVEAIEKEVRKYEGWKASSEAELQQILPGTEKVNTELERIEKYSKKIAELKAIL